MNVYKNLSLSFFTKKGIKKKENKQNLCIQPPAIYSFPNGPANFLPNEGSYPKISLSKIN